MKGDPRDIPVCPYETIWEYTWKYTLMYIFQYIYSGISLLFICCKYKLFYTLTIHLGKRIWIRVWLRKFYEIKKMFGWNNFAMPTQSHGNWWLFYEVVHSYEFCTNFYDFYVFVRFGLKPLTCLRFYTIHIVLFHTYYQLCKIATNTHKIKLVMLVRKKNDKIIFKMLNFLFIDIN